MEVEGIILAAGLSSRAGTFKMTLAFNGKTVIENTIDNMLAVCSRVVVVGGHQKELLEPVIARYSNVELVYNEDYLQGMFSSVKKGMRCIRTDRFFLTPGDYPLILPWVYTELLNYEAPVVLPAFGEKRGHPVLLSREIIRQVAQRSDFQTLREVILENETVMVPVDCEGIILDIDTLEDYQSLLKLLT